VSDPNLYLKYETSNIFLETVINEVGRSWSILTNHAGSCWASPTDARLRDIAASLGITGRSAYGIVTDLTAAGVRRQAERRPPPPLPDPGAPTGTTRPPKKIAQITTTTSGS
jgi:hypothetical protein